MGCNAGHTIARATSKAIDIFLSFQLMSKAPSSILSFKVPKHRVSLMLDVLEANLHCNTPTPLQRSGPNRSPSQSAAQPLYASNLLHQSNMNRSKCATLPGCRSFNMTRHSAFTISMPSSVISSARSRFIATMVPRYSAWCTVPKEPLPAPSMPTLNDQNQRVGLACFQSRWQP